MAGRVSRSRPSTSSAPSPPPDASNSSEKTYVYDISVKLMLDIPVTINDREKAIAAASAILVSHIFTSHPEYSFLATPVLRVVDSALLTTDNKWEVMKERTSIKKDFRLRGNLINIKEKPSESDPTFDQLSYNGCVSPSRVLMEYKIDFHFLPGILSAQRIYEAHEWKKDETSQDDDDRSVRIREIIDYHEGKASMSHDYTWIQAFGVKGRVEKKKTAAKRKLQED